MFGKNPISKPRLDEGQFLRIVKGSPFYTIQGEGPYIGHPATFVRLHGCCLRCTFCDTNFSDESDPVVGVWRLVQDILKLPAHLVVITGGEPLNQNIVPLCIMLGEHGIKVQVETSGAVWVPGLEHHAEIVVSPKTPTIHPMVYNHAMAFKYVISVDMTFDDFIPITATQPDTRPARLASPRLGAPVYLSPLDQYNTNDNTRNRRLVAELALKFGCIAGIQLHKALGVEEPA